MNIEDLHDHIISMWSSATEQYWDAYECGDVDGMFNAIEPFTSDDAKKNLDK